MTRLIKFLLLLFCSQLLLSGLLAETEEYVFNDDHVKLTNEIIEILEKHHFTKKKYLSIKTEALDSFLDRLDPSRSVFLEKEVNSFAAKTLMLRSMINMPHLSKHLKYLNFTGQGM